nr:helix-turn-helix domain-containing protein [Amycolatopsis acidicola]
MTATEHGTLCDTQALDSALNRAFGFLGKRWNGVILASLALRGPVGFADLKRQVGKITDSVLSDRLTELALTGLVVRTVSDTRPPTVSYELTPAGVNLIPVFHQLAAWAAENLPEKECSAHPCSS